MDYLGGPNIITRFLKVEAGGRRVRIRVIRCKKDIADSKRKEGAMHQGMYWPPQAGKCKEMNTLPDSLEWNTALQTP